MSQPHDPTASEPNRDQKILDGLCIRVGCKNRALLFSRWCHTHHGDVEATPSEQPHEWDLGATDMTSYRKNVYTVASEQKRPSETEQADIELDVTDDSDFGLKRVDEFEPTKLATPPPKDIASGELKQWYPSIAKLGQKYREAALAHDRSAEIYAVEDIMKEVQSLISAARIDGRRIQAEAAFDKWKWFKVNRDIKDFDVFLSGQVDSWRYTANHNLNREETEKQ